jgi:hypothetical protein
VVIKEEILETDIEIKQEQITGSECLESTPQTTCKENETKKIKILPDKAKYMSSSDLNKLKVPINVFSCEQCQKIFISQQYLDIHLLSHGNGDETVIKQELFDPNEEAVGHLDNQFKLISEIEIKEEELTGINR